MEKVPKIGKDKEPDERYNGPGSQRCKCKECGNYYTIEPKQHENPEGTRELTMKMYYAR